MKFELYIIETTTGLIFTELLLPFQALYLFLTTDNAIALHKQCEDGTTEKVL